MSNCTKHQWNYPKSTLSLISPNIIVIILIFQSLSELSNMEYRLVKLRGKFLHDKEMLMGPRSLIRPDGGETQGGLFSQRDAGNGYLIVTPFQLADRE